VGDPLPRHSRHSIECPKLLAAILSIALIPAACTSQQTAAQKRITPDYDPNTGRLRLLKYDSDGDGKIDTVSYMDGARMVKVEIDKDEDGKVDRWEYYGPDQKIEKIGFSRAGDGKEDAWSYVDPAGGVVRIEISTRHDGTVSRIEHYQLNALVAAEEDADGDGRVDTWEAYDGDRLSSIAYDTQHRGVPDRRLIYGPNGTARVEVDVRGDGHFVPANESRPGRSK
jgi:hypothetical protein